MDYNVESVSIILSKPCISEEYTGITRNRVYFFL